MKIEHVQTRDGWVTRASYLDQFDGSPMAASFYGILTSAQATSELERCRKNDRAKRNPAT